VRFIAAIIVLAIYVSSAFAQAPSITASQLALQICQSVTALSQAVDKAQATNSDLANQITVLKEKCGKVCESDSKKPPATPAQP
jgi:hypothetical protein